MLVAVKVLHHSVTPAYSSEQVSLFGGHIAPSQVVFIWAWTTQLVLTTKIQDPHVFSLLKGDGHKEIRAVLQKS